MGSLYISSILGSYAQLPDNFKDIVKHYDNFYKSSELKELKELAKKAAYSLDYESLDGKEILTFGKSWKIGYGAIYSGWFGSASDFITKNDLDTKGEEIKIQESLEKFLKSLPEKYQWVKDLEWEEVGIYLQATS